MLRFIYETRVKYGPVISKNVNNYVNTAKRIEKNKLAIEFIKKCLENEKLPQFSRINLHNNDLSQNNKFLENIRKEITNKVLIQKSKAKNKQYKELQKLRNDLFDLDADDCTKLDQLVEEKKRKIQDEVGETHRRKLKALGIEENFIIDNRNINSRRNNIDKKEAILNVDTIFNYSKRILSEVETSVLNKGLKFGIKNRKIDTYEIISRFEELAQSLDWIEIKPTTSNDPLKANLNNKSSFMQQLQQMTYEFLELSKKALDSLSDEEHKALKSLSEDKTIVISKADKGNAVVIQDIETYRSKILELLKQKGKFKKLKENETLKRERNLQNFLRTLNRKERKHRLSDTDYKRILPCGSRAGVMYGLPKIHKDNCPLRPIISAVGTYNYKLAKFLVEILTPLMSDSKFILKDTFDFVNKVSNLDPRIHKFLLSFDVESLFTNIPTLETIEIILKKAYKRNRKYFHGLTREELRELLIICTQESHFQFNNEFFDQVDGVSMGSPLGPLFANIFMADFEEKHMEKLEQLGVNMWFRFVDDVFSTLNNPNNVKDILEFLNSCHPNIKFTIEKEEKNSLPFLDTRVIRNVDKYVTTIYHKKTFTGVYLNWKSLTARKYKIGFINCLLNRIWKICTTQEHRDEEVAKLRVILKKNDYPDDVIETTINKYIARISLPSQPKPTKEYKRYIVLPFVNRKAEDFAVRLKKLVEENYTQVDFNVAFKAPNTIGNMFPFKDRVKNIESQSLVVYKINCATCNAEYIGKTERILIHRMKEHSKSKNSACYQHVEDNPDHHMDYENIKIIDRASSDFKLRMKELLHILKTKPELNKQMNSQSKYEIKTLIIQAYEQHQSK